MTINKANLVLDNDYRTILVQEFVTDYPGTENLCTPEAIVQVLNDVFQLDRRAEEYLYLIALNSQNVPISFCEISHGTATLSLVGIREIMVRLLLCGAVNFVVAHNHPGGNPSPSGADMAVTEEIKQAANLLKLHFCDHIIIGRDKYCSFQTEGLLTDTEA